MPVARAGVRSRGRVRHCLLQAEAARGLAQFLERAIGRDAGAIGRESGIDERPELEPDGP